MPGLDGAHEIIKINLHSTRNGIIVARGSINIIDATVMQAKRATKTTNEVTTLKTRKRLVMLKPQPM
ncbi:hypothetical protein [Candidatus Spongiihabitans sp.]|uniref:hypothetical protein n=1 Tax=Candidatus Spongiihabitans sp. TaxID=3101308 RepID=UPI003C6F41FC